MSFDFNKMDPSNPEHREFGYKLMITLLTERLGGNAEFTEAEVNAIAGAGRLAHVGKRYDSGDEPILTFKILSQVEYDEENKRSVKELLKSFGLPAEMVDKAVEDAQRDIERERLERQFKL